MLRFQVFNSASIDALDEILVPCIQLDHLYVVYGLCCGFHSAIFRFHYSFLKCAKHITDEEIEAKSKGEDSYSSKECIPEDIEAETEGSDEGQRHLDDTRDLVTEPVEALSIYLHKVDDLT